MNYEFRIQGAQEEDGHIKLGRLADLANGINKIAEGALQIRLRGISLTVGRKKLSLKDALNVELSGVSKGSTVLKLEARPFAETLEDFQLDAFGRRASRIYQSTLPSPCSPSALRKRLVARKANIWTNLF
ncbi:MAG: hypothetical protein U5L96_06100 [Owenweeksia sp.]|nr:hypothetical protein [Owenweeksia sp.]